MGSKRVTAELLRTEYQSLRKMWVLSNKIVQYYAPIIRMFAHIYDLFKRPLKGRGNGGGHLVWKEITVRQV